jgi:hypothetical protein
MWISPKYQDTDFSFPLEINQKIILFEDQVVGWKLMIADRLINGEKDENGIQHKQGIQGSGFAVLDIVFSYFEMIAKFYDGYKGKYDSKKYFRKGVRLVFPSIAEISNEEIYNLLDLLYDDCRCALYHTGFLSGRIMITGEFPAAIGFEKNNHRLIINPHRLPRALLIHFSSYINDLKNVENTMSREKFEARFDYLMEISS